MYITNQTSNIFGGFLDITKYMMYNRHITGGVTPYMTRKEIYLTDKQIKRIDKERGETSRSEAIRRIIDYYYEQKDKGDTTNATN
jgi:hypothetical protein